MRLLVFAFLVLLGSAVQAQPTAADSVRVAFAGYREAVAVRDGAAAYGWVDTRTRAYYRALAEAVRHAPEAQVRGLPFAEQLAVLSARLRVPSEELLRMDGEALFARAVGEGWVGRDVARATLRHVEVHGSEARALGVLGGQALPLEMVFRREREGWRLDLVALAEAAAGLLDSVMRQAGLTPTDLALRLLAGETGRPVPPTVWHPPAPR